MLLVALTFPRYILRYRALILSSLVCVHLARYGQAAYTRISRTLIRAKLLKRIVSDCLFTQFLLHNLLLMHLYAALLGAPMRTPFQGLTKRSPFHLFGFISIQSSSHFLLAFLRTPWSFWWLAIIAKSCPYMSANTLSLDIFLRIKLTSIRNNMGGTFRRSPHVCFMASSLFTEEWIESCPTFGGPHGNFLQIC